MTTAMIGIGLKRLQHLVLWVADVGRSVRFYRDILGFEVKTQSPRAAFLRIPGSPDDHHLGLFEHTGVRRGRMRAWLACTMPPGRSATSPTSSARADGSWRRARSSARRITG